LAGDARRGAEPHRQDGPQPRPPPPAATGLNGGGDPMWQHVAEAGRALARGVAELLYPPACLLCGRPPADLTGPAAHFCRVCLDTLTNDPHESCPRCALTVGPFSNVADGCPRCRKESLG